MTKRVLNAGASSVLATLSRSHANDPAAPSAARRGDGARLGDPASALLRALITQEPAEPPEEPPNRPAPQAVIDLFR